MCQGSRCQWGHTRRHGENQNMWAYICKWGRGGRHGGKPEAKLITSTLGVEVPTLPPRRGSHPGWFADAHLYPPSKSRRRYPWARGYPWGLRVIVGITERRWTILQFLHTFRVSCRIIAQIVHSPFFKVEALSSPGRPAGTGMWFPNGCTFVTLL